MQNRVDVITLIREHANLHPQQPAYCNSASGNDLTYAELIERADEVAAWLRRRGCRPGDRCGLMLPEGRDFLVAALGILAAQLCIVPIGTFLLEEEVDFAIDTAGLHWLLRENEELFRSPLASTIDNQNDEEFLACDPAYIRFTSGSTGRRKGVFLGHETILQRLTAANDLLQIGTTDKIWFTLPMVDHFVVSTLLYLSRGATIISTTNPNQAAAEQATVIYGAPDFYRELVDSEISRLDAVRLAISTTAPLSAQVATDFAKKFGTSLNPALGIIEVGLLTINYRPNKPGSVGIIMPSYTAMILGEDGNPASPQEIGELHVNGKGLLDAYLAPWRPRKALLGTYGFPTRDYARFDEDGYLFLVGRGKNRLNIGGLQFFCEEIESILNTLPGVEKSRVFINSGILSAEVVGRLDSTDEVTKLLAGKIDSRKIPTKFYIVSTLPRTSNGKLKRIESSP